MAARLAAIGILVTALTALGIFLWPIPRPPGLDSSAAWHMPGPPASAERRIAGPSGPWMLYVWALPGAERTVTVTVAARDLQERPVAATVAPTATFAMLDTAMDAQRVVLAQERSGFWRGSGRVSMAGRWNLRVELNGETVNVPFEIADVSSGGRSAVQER